MDLKSSTISLAVIILLGATFMVTALTEDSSMDVITGYSFDTDSNGLDDRIDNEIIDLPVWTFVHVGTAVVQTGTLEEITSTGAHVRKAYSIVPVASVQFTSYSQIHDVIGLQDVGLIEVQSSVHTLMDTSTRAIKANPSTDYSPRTARDLGMTGKGVTIAVIDTGVDNEHPTFQGAFAAGVDFTAPINTPLNPADGTFDPDDRSGHGTGVASVALGRGDAEGNHRGVAPEAGLIDLKVIGMGSLTLNQNSVMDALQWCSDNKDTTWGDTGYRGVDIVSLSLGTGNDGGAVAQSMDALVNNGIVVVQGSGNSGSQYGPSAETTWADRSLVVGVVDDQDTVDRSDDEIWSSSTYGPRTDDGDNNPYDELRPDVVAPGVAISFASSSRTSNLQGANGWSSGSGTSYATPHVAGTVALMLQARSSLGPDANTNPVSKIIHQTAEARGTPYDETLSSKYDTRYGYGILDAYEAVKSSLSYSAVNHRPEITYFAVEPDITTAGSTCRVRAVAVDVDEEVLQYELSVDDGDVSGEAPIWNWKAPNNPGKYYFNLAVTDPQGGKATASTFVVVEEGVPNRPPVITSFKAGQDVLVLGGTTTLRVVAIDQDGDDLIYDYNAERGTIQGTGEEVIYEAPSMPMTDRVTVTVNDGKGGTDSRSMDLDIREVAVNSPPVITLATLEPSIINSNTSQERVLLFVQVEDPDGLEDIDLVLADLRSIGGASGVQLLNDGVDPDAQANDLEFTLELEDITGLDNGTYPIQISVFDMGGGTDTASVKLVIDIPSTTTVTKGKKQDLSPVVIIVIILVIVLIAAIIIGSIMAARRKKTTSLAIPQQQGYQVQYPYVPTQQKAPRFQPVQRR